MDFNKIKEAAQGYQKDMTAFLRAIVKNPGESCDEKAHIDTIAAEMKKLDFDEVVIDPQGNVIGYMGTGDKIIAYDAHIDTVGIGNIDNWNFDPYEGYENDTEIGGRGVSDQCGGLVSAVYGARIMKDLNLIPEGCKIMVVGTVQEEDCDGLCWQYIINEDKIRPEFVVSTEPTDGGIYRGQRGRMEIRIDVKGVSCHGSAPERGDNAIYKMADILQDVRALNENDDADETEIKGLVKMLNPKYNPDWEEARFLGRGTVTVSQIFYTSPSRCAVADSCAVSLDRRMTFGETWESCLDEIRALPSVKKYGDDVVAYPCTTMTVRPTQDAYTRSSATSRHGRSRKTTRLQRHLRKPTLPSTETRGSALPRHWKCGRAVRLQISGHSPQTVFLSWGETGSRASDSDQAPKLRHTRRTRRHGNRIS